MTSIVLFKAESDKDDKDEFVELLKNNQLKVYSVSPIKFELKNLDCLSERLNDNFRSTYSSFIVTSPRVIQILKHLIDEQKITTECLKSIPFITVGPQTYKKLINEFEITPLINNTLENINNVKELANYLNELSDEFLSKLIDSTKPMLYPTSDQSKDELSGYLNDKFKTEKLICYQTLPNGNLDHELNSIFKQHLKQSNHTIENEFLFVFFSPSGVKSVKQQVNCLKVEQMKSIAIGPTTKSAIEENKLNLIATSAKPTPDCLLETILKFIKNNLKN